jgi:hypothetical protein
MIKKIIIGLLILGALGGGVYKVMNPTPYKHPLHR